MLKLLLADDERKIREGIKQIIDWESLGIKLLDLAPNGIAAYNLIASQKPDIVITDLLMPGMTGLELIEKTLSDENIKNPVFIILSGYSDFEFAQTAMKYGVRYYLLKPTSEEEIIKVLKDVIWLIRHDNNPVRIPENKSEYGKNIVKLINYIDDNLENPNLSLKLIAQNIIFMNEEYLGKLFYKEVGVKFSQYLQQRRISKAKSILKSDPEISVGEVAKKVGYIDNPQYFNTVFKKHVGTTPKKYQNQRLT